MQKSSLLQGITGLRFFAALAVIIGHIEMMKKVFNLNTLWYDLNNIYTQAPITYIAIGKMPWIAPLISHLGFYAVVFFFVLSGFLITHVLIKEKQNKGSFSIVNFYKRRALKIWPLYLMLVLFALGIGAIHWEIFNYPNQPNWLSFKSFVEACHFLFSPNIALLFVPAIGMVGHLWSIGVEEHFYLFWPWLLKKIKERKNLILAFGATWIAAKIVFKIMILVFHLPFQEITLYLIFNKFECMALGGYLAYVFNDDNARFKQYLQKNNSKLLFINAPVFILATYFLAEKWANFNYLFVAVFSGILIFKVTKTKEDHWLNRPLLQWLGNSSYAIYIVHFPVILAILNLQFRTNHFYSLNIFQNISLYAQTILISILLGVVLHEWIEKPLKKKLG